MICALAVGLKFKLGFDDSLDVVGVHLVGGLDGHTADRFPRRAGGARRRSRVCSTAVGSISCGARQWVRLRFSPTRSSLRLSWRYILKFTIGLRLGEEEEADGIDEAEHAETGYDFATVGSSSVLGRPSPEE